MYNANLSGTTCRWCKYHRWYLEGKKYGCNAEPNENICPSYRSVNEDYIKPIHETEKSS